MSNKKKWKRIVPPIDYLQGLANDMRTETSHKRIVTLIREMMQCYAPLNMTFASGTPYFRARSTNGGTFNTTSELYYPPRHWTGVGRLNEPNEPLLYLSLQQNTALAEVHSSAGSYAQVSGFQQSETEPLRLISVGDFFNIANYGYSFLPQKHEETIRRIIRKMDYEPALSVAFLDGFLAEILADPDARSSEYIRSRTVANVLREKIPNLDGFHYPSVARAGSRNIAIAAEAADHTMKLCGAALLSVTNQFDYGLYRFKVERHSNIFNDDGRIVWRSEPASHFM